MKRYTTIFVRIRDLDPGVVLHSMITMLKLSYLPKAFAGSNLEIWTSFEHGHGIHPNGGAIHLQQPSMLSGAEKRRPFLPGQNEARPGQIFQKV